VSKQQWAGLYLADSLQRVTDVQSRRRLRSSSSSTPIVSLRRRATLRDRAFPVSSRDRPGRIIPNPNKYPISDIVYADWLLATVWANF